MDNTQPKSYCEGKFPLSPRTISNYCSVLVPDLLLGLLSNWRVACCGHGEQQCGGAPPLKAWQVPAPPARELCPVPQVCLLWYEHTQTDGDLTLTVPNCEGASVNSALKLQCPLTVFISIGFLKATCQLFEFYLFLYHFLVQVTWFHCFLCR